MPGIYIGIGMEDVSSGIMSDEMDMQQLLELQEKLEQQVEVEDAMQKSADDRLLEFWTRMDNNDPADRWMYLYLKRERDYALLEYCEKKAQLDGCTARIAELSA